MMKKKLALVLCVLLCCAAFAGCGGSKMPENMTEQVYEWGCDVVSLTDDFLNGKQTDSEFKKNLSYYEDKMKNIEKTDEYYLDDHVKSSTDIIAGYLSLPGYHKDDIKSARDSLAGVLGVN